MEALSAQQRWSPTGACGHASRNWLQRAPWRPFLHRLAQPCPRVWFSDLIETETKKSKLCHEASTAPVSWKMIWTTGLYIIMPISAALLGERTWLGHCLDLVASLSPSSKCSGCTTSTDRASLSLRFDGQALSWCFSVLELRRGNLPPFDLSTF